MRIQVCFFLKVWLIPAGAESFILVECILTSMTINLNTQLLRWSFPILAVSTAA